MPRILSHVLVLVAVLAATGSHWLVLKTVAWSGMLADNLQTASICEAVQQTFSGENPCSLCHAVSSGRKAESEKKFTLDLKRFEFVWEAAAIFISAPTAFRELPAWAQPFSTQLHRPPLPPPRLFFG